MESGRPEESRFRLLNHADLPTAVGKGDGFSSIFLMALAAAAVAHLTVFFVLTPGSLPLGFPVYHDDFNNLRYTSPVWIWTPVRPLSTFLLTCLSSLGIEAFYLSLHLLTVLYQALVLSVVFLLLRVPRPSFLLLLGAAIPAQAFENAAEVFLYTGLVTNLLSGVLGTAAIGFLITAIREPVGRSKRLVAVVGLYVAALLAKEDFVLPVLIVFGWEAFLAWRGHHRLDKRVLLTGGALLLIPAAHLFGSSLLFPDTFLFVTHPAYQPVFRLQSLVNTLLVYLFAERGSFAICVLGLVTTATWVLIRREGMGRALVTALVPFAIMAPDLLLPLNVHQSHSFFWLCWISGLGLGLGSLGIPANGKLWSRAPVAGLLLASAGILAITRFERNRISHWYSNHGSVNRNIVATLVRSRKALAKESVVAVTGLPDYNPWFYTDAGFLTTRLGLSCRWEIFVPEESVYYRLEVLDSNRPIRATVVTHRLSELDARSDLLVLRLRPDGIGYLDATGVLNPALADSGVDVELLGGGLNRPSNGRITGWVDGNGFLPGDQIRIDGTFYPTTVFGNSSWLTFEIDEEPVVNRPTLRIEVVRSGSRAPIREIILQRP